MYRNSRQGISYVTDLFGMASLSPSPTILYRLPNGICKPILDITNQYYYMRVQISGHSSVQSSSTFRSRKAEEPIYILRFKKIEQGQLLYPKIFPHIFLNTCQVRSPNCSRMLKSGPDKLSPKAMCLQLGFPFSSR